MCTTETINDRIEMLVNKHFNGNKAAFAKAIGLPPTGLSSYLSKQRRSKPSIDMVVKIINLLNVDARWLLTGQDDPHQAPTQIHTSGDFSPATNDGNVSVVVGDPVLAERIRSLETLLDEKDQRIADLKERISELKK